MTNLKRIEWRGGTSAHANQQQPRRSQRDLVQASLLRSGVGSRRLWDETARVEYRNRPR
ncbi:MAG: hypothetical protein ACR2ML_06685 [Solirubrobacteraceae bacterium]